MVREHQFDGSVGSLGSDPFGLTAVLEASAKTADTDARLEGDEVLMGAAVALERARENIETAHARVLATLESTGATDASVGMRTGAWLAWECDSSVAKCRSRVAAAKRLGWFPEFSEAVGTGAVRFAHCEVLASVANPRNRAGLRAAQGVLIEWAEQFRFALWAEMVRALAADLDQDGAFDPNEDPSRNRLRLRDNRDGTVEVNGTLNATTAVTVTQGLEALADELFALYKTDRETDPDLLMPSRPQLLAEALAHAVRLALSADVNSTRPPRIEATIVLEDDTTAHTDTTGHDDSTDSAGVTDSTGHTGVTDSTATADLDGSNRCGLAGHGACGVRFRIRDLCGREIAPSTAELLLTDADMRALLLDVDGCPLWLGRTVRFVTPSQKQALAVRDGGCIFPGCDMPAAWCDAHHEPHWKPDGRTDIDKMFLACRHHHGVTHRKGWTCRADPQRPQQWIWTTPTGRQIHSQRQHLRPH